MHCEGGCANDSTLQLLVLSLSESPNSQISLPGQISVLRRKFWLTNQIEEEREIKASARQDQDTSGKRDRKGKL